MMQSLSIESWKSCRTSALYSCFLLLKPFQSACVAQSPACSDGDPSKQHWATLVLVEKQQQVER